MDKKRIIADAEEFTQSSPLNYVSDEVSLRQDLAGMRIFDPPVFSFGTANDELYARYKTAEVIGSHFLSPHEWLPEAKTVISFFLPYSEKIKSANSADYEWPADEWLHGRIEGQQFITELTAHILKLLSEAGYSSIAPSLDPRYRMGNAGFKFTSNWSQRHVAFACGLGTFGLSKGIITKKGMCGCLGSVLTELELPVDSRRYEDIYEYCNMCGVCISHCPAKAISYKEGKKHTECSAFLDEVLKENNPRYGCGKCQVKVPCESGIPAK